MSACSVSRASRCDSGDLVTHLGQRQHVRDRKSGRDVEKNIVREVEQPHRDISAVSLQYFYVIELVE